MMNTFVVLAVAFGSIAQGEPKVILTTDAPVYKVGAGSVKIAVKNAGTGAILLDVPGPWAVYDPIGAKLVYTPITVQVPVTLAPGQQTSWTWNKKDSSGKPVPPGTYRVTVRVGAVKFSQWIAITPTGKIAGAGYFPLSLGNSWYYASASPSWLWVVAQDSSWSRLKGALGNIWVQKGQKQTLFFKKGSSVTPLFRFGLPWKFWYPVQFDSMSGLYVGALNETVVTPAGTFVGCYRLDASESGGASAGFVSFWFAPGIGLVQYSRLGPGGKKTSSLRYATLKGTDGKFYGFGRK